MGNPQVFQGYPDPDPVRTRTRPLGMGFAGYGYGYCKVERCLQVEFKYIPQVTREGGRGRKAAILKIREHADGDQEKHRCQCIGIKRQHIDVIRQW